MNRYVRAAAAALLVAGGLGSAGCAHHGKTTAGGCGTGGCGAGGRSDVTCGDKYRNLIDTSWPDRYNYDARQAVLAPFAQQVANGHFLEQTVWNWHFEPGTDTLNTAGMEKLNSLARKTPAPDPKLYVQVARDVAGTPENLDKLGAVRDELTAKRAAAVLKYMASQPGNPVPYEVAVHDAPTPGIYAPFAAAAFRGQLPGYVGGLAGGGIGGVGGAAAGGGGGAAAGAGGAAAGPGY